MSQLKIKDGNNWISIPASGVGVPVGGTTGQVLAKTSGTDYDTAWVDQSGSAASVASITLAAANWTGNGPYTQTVTISGATITANTLVDLRPDATTMTQLITDVVTSLFIENNSGTLTAYALNAAPTVNLTIQCTLMEAT